MKSPSFSRRSFLQSILAAGAAPLVLPSRTWSAESKPNSRITIGLIGTGKQAGGHITGFMSRTDVQLVAVCDVENNRRANSKRIVEEFYAKKTESGYKGC